MRELVKQSIPTMLLRLNQDLLRPWYDAARPQYDMEADLPRCHPDPLRSAKVLPRLYPTVPRLHYDLLRVYTIHPDCTTIYHDLSRIH